MENNKGIIIVLCHTIEYDSGNVVIDESAEESLHDLIANEIEYSEMPYGTEILDLEDEEGNPLEIEVPWKIVNPEADKWKNVGHQLYMALENSAPMTEQVAKNKYESMSKFEELWKITSGE